ncbi:cupin domain-containing protein [Candidatus Woesearchaeota archaeon]|nr:cupin domain-containing protein [Candidatus Woesearchaeota archaeon]
MIDYKMKMYYKNIKELIEYSKGGILSKVLNKSDKNDITLFCMAEGTEISEHTSTRQGFVFVLEGDGIFNMMGEGIRMSSGIMIPLKKGVVHSIEAKKKTSFILSLSN